MSGDNNSLKQRFEMTPFKSRPPAARRKAKHMTSNGASEPQPNLQSLLQDTFGTIKHILYDDVTTLNTERMLLSGVRGLNEQLQPAD